jgi:hypothetical protein
MSASDQLVFASINTGQGTCHHNDVLPAQRHSTNQLLTRSGIYSSANSVYNLLDSIMDQQGLS